MGRALGVWVSQYGVTTTLPPVPAVPAAAPPVPAAAPPGPAVAPPVPAVTPVPPVPAVTPVPPVPAMGTYVPALPPEDAPAEDPPVFRGGGVGVAVSEEHP